MQSSCAFRCWCLLYFGNSLLVSNCEGKYEVSTLYLASYIVLCLCFSCCTCIYVITPKHDVNMYLYLEFCCCFSYLSKKRMCYVQKEESTKLAINLLGFVEAALFSNMTITYLLMSNESIYLCCTAYYY